MKCKKCGHGVEEHDAITTSGLSKVRPMLVAHGCRAVTQAQPLVECSCKDFEEKKK